MKNLFFLTCAMVRIGSLIAGFELMVWEQYMWIIAAIIGNCIKDGDI